MRALESGIVPGLRVGRGGLTIGSRRPGSRSGRDGAAGTVSAGQTSWPRLAGYSIALALAVGLAVHLLHVDHAERLPIDPALHWLRDSALAIPVAWIAILVGTHVAHVLRRRAHARADDPELVLAWALVVSVVYAVAMIPGAEAHGAVFVDGVAMDAHGSHDDGLLHSVRDAAATLFPSTASLLVLARVFGLPIRVDGVRAPFRIRLATFRVRPVPRMTARLAAVLATVVLAFPISLPVRPVPVAAAAQLPTAGCDATTAGPSYDVVAMNAIIPYNRWGQVDVHGMLYALSRDAAAIRNWWRPLADNAADDPAGNRRLRPRPLVLRANAGDCVRVSFRNELDFNQGEGVPDDPRASIHVHGAAYDAQTSDGSRVGFNPDTTVGRGETITYYWVAPPDEGLYFFHDHATQAGSEADGGSNVHGLFGAFVVEPAGSTYRDPVSGLALYGNDTATQSGELYIDAVIDAPSGSFRESIQLAQDEIPSIGFGFNYGSEPGDNRERFGCPDCVSEETSLSSWPFGDPALVKLASGATRAVGVNADGEPILDVVAWPPSPGGHPEDCGVDRLLMPAGVEASCWTSNVAHAYPGDPTKIRFGLAGVKETHVFHMHAHQWLSEPADVGAAGSNPSRPSDTARPQSTTIDSQTFGPAEMFTADLLFGAGSRNGTIGDAIFHCHLYPHFAEGFWSLFRVHDVREDGTNTTPDGIRVRNLVPIGATPPDDTPENPGYPRFIPGQVGWRAPQPPLGVSDPGGAPAVRIVAGQALDPALMNSVQTIWTTGQPVSEVQSISHSAVPTGEVQAISHDGAPRGEVHEITAGGATDGTFTLPYGAESTAEIAYNADAATVEAAIDALASLGDVTVTGNGTAASPWVVTYAASDGDVPEPVPVDTFTEPVDVVVTSTTAAAPGGSFTLTYGSETTGEIAWDANAAALESALDALVSLGDVSVTGDGTGPNPWLVTFDPADGDVPLPTPADTFPGTAAVLVTTTGLFTPGGTFTLSYDGEVTTGIAWNAGAADVEAALDALALGDVTVTGTGAVADPWIVGFDAGDGDVPDPVVNSSLAGGISPSVVETTKGVPAASFSLLYDAATAGPIAANATATDVEASLEALDAIGDVSVTGAGTELDPWVVTFLSPARNVLPLTLPEDTPPATIRIDTVKSDLELRLETEAARMAAGPGAKPGAPFADPCPAGAREVTYNVSVLQRDIVYNEAGWHDTQGRLLVLDEDLAAVVAGTKEPEPLFIRVNAGDCVNFNLTNLLPNWIGNDAFLQLRQTNMVGEHIHLVKFDVLASDGSSNGWNYQEAAFTEEQLNFNRAVIAGTADCDATPGGCILPNPPDWDPTYSGIDPGQTIHERWYADYELRTVFTHDHHFPAIDQNRGLFGALIVEPKGMDFRDPRGGFRQPINNPGNGPVCGTACEGTAAGARMDVIGPEASDDFREFGLGIQDFVPLTRAGGNPQNPDDVFNPPVAPEPYPDADPGVMGINYRNAPFLLRDTRNGTWVDPAYRFSSYVFGDPQTPVLQAYGGDPVRFRVIQGSQEEQHVMMIHGVRWADEPDDPESPLSNSRAMGVSDAFNFETPGLMCDADEDPCVGDFLYSSAATDDVYLGMWGIFRVHGKGTPGLLPLPDNIPQAQNRNAVPQPSGSPPPRANKPGDPCPANAPVRQFEVVAFQKDLVYNDAGDHDPYGLMYALASDEAAIRAGTKPAEPLVLRVNEGDCIEVSLTNKLTSAFLNHKGADIDHPEGGDPNLPLEPPTGTRAGLRVSLHPQLVVYDVRGSDGATVGFNRDQTVGPGDTILYRWYADDVSPGELGAINLLDYGDLRGHRHHGLFAGLVVEPRNATVHDPFTGAQIRSGAIADVRVPGMPDYRDPVLFFQDGLNLRDAVGNLLPDPFGHPPAAGEPAELLDAEDQGEKGFNYRNEPFHHRLGRDPGAPLDDLDPDGLAWVHSSTLHGDPATPIIRAYTGDEIRLRLLQGSDKPRQHAFQQAGHSWIAQPHDPGSTRIATLGGFSVGRKADVFFTATDAPGDYRYACAVLFHHLSGGLWGITRIYEAPNLIAGSGLFQADERHPIMPLGLAQIRAAVFDDGDQDRNWDAAEPPIPAASVRLRAAGSDGAGAILGTAWSGSDGWASFAVVPGPYDVSVDTPSADWAGTTPAWFATNTQNQDGASGTVGFVRLGDITVRLFDDIDGSGARNGTEGVLSGWTVTLTRAGAGQADTAQSGTTNASGEVTFDQLRPANYTASVTPPAGWNATTPNPIGIALPENGSLIRLTGFARQAGLSVKLFNDANSNDRQDPGESSLAGWKVDVTGGPVSLSPHTSSGTTGPNGAAAFTTLQPGPYSIAPELKTDWSFASASAQTDGAATPGFSCTSLPCTTQLIEQTQQVVTLAVHNPKVTIVVDPFNDLNNDGIQQAGERGKLIGWEVDLYTPTGTTPIQSTATGNNGRATFYFHPGPPDNQPRSYVVKLTEPAGSDPHWAPTPATAPLANGAQDVAINVTVLPGEVVTARRGFIQLGTVGVQVFFDQDQNRAWDEYENPLANRTVRLYDAKGRTLLGQKATDTNGHTAFQVATSTEYQVEVLTPSGWVATTPLGTNGQPTTKVKVTSASSATQSVQAAAGGFGQYSTADSVPPPVPTAMPPGGAYEGAQQVTLASETGATIRYTTDGSTPSASQGTVYSGPITVAATLTLTAVAIDGAGNVSGVMTQSYEVTVREGGGAPATWTPLKGSVKSGTAASLAANDQSYLEIASAKSGNRQAVDGYASTTIPAGQRSVASLVIEYDGGASAGGGTRNLYLYDFSAAAWVRIRTETQTAADLSAKVTAPSNPVRFVSPTGEVRLRVEVVAGSAFTLRADFVKATWTY